MELQSLFERVPNVRLLCLIHNHFAVAGSDVENVLRLFAERIDAGVVYPQT